MDKTDKQASDKPDKPEDIYLTREGRGELQKEYEVLTEQRRPRAVQRLAETRVIGDMEESSDYSQAKQDLSFIDGRIAELEEVLGRAKLISKGHSSCKQAGLGCMVTVKAGKAEHIFHLVGEWEADPAEKKISHESPLGKALMGKKKGDKVEVEAPAGKITYTILKIE
jgi:transcription elongation factor GreA